MAPPLPTRVLGVLNGARLPASVLAPRVLGAELVLAADGGADALLELGLMPDAVVGDLDSLRADPAVFPVVARDADPDRTDLDKLLDYASGSGARSIVLANVEGGHADHAHAALLSAARSPLRVELLFERGAALVLRGPVEGRVLSEGRLSLLPLVPCAGVDLRGVRWPLTDAALEPLGRVSVSNQGEGEVRYAIGAGTAILYYARPADPGWDAAT